ncbi:MAG TPA: DsbA family oxidoreductase [Bacteroidia bacterium]|jgi:predicted DsbA family dithiol-disulfide isomerase|nr:DsbA family oxidoreductase [Bacteroidia bacterium]
MNSTQHTLKVEIWSDIMCPFCYIGKRKFENALSVFPEKNKIEVEWKSFQLAPEMKTTPGKTIHEYLAEHKGFSLTDARRMNDHVTAMAAKVGLTYNFDKAVVANSFNVHRFSHFAKVKGKQNEAEEKLFQAYFTEGKNMDDYSTLIQLGEEIGLEPMEIRTALEKGSFRDDVTADIEEAHQLGVNGVPFFVFNRKYAISGAQESQTFTQVLTKSFEEWNLNNPIVITEMGEGEVCTPDGECK